MKLLRLLLLITCFSFMVACGPLIEKETSTTLNDKVVEGSEESIEANMTELQSEEETPKLSEEDLLKSVQEFAVSDIPSGYIIDDIKASKITGKDYSDFVVLFKHEADPLMNYPLVKAYTYKENSWDSFLIVDEDDFGGISLKLSGSHSFISSDREEVLLDEVEGSGGFLSVYIVGSKDGETIELLHKTEGLSNANFSFENGTLVISGSNQETTVKWNSSSKNFE